MLVHHNVCALANLHPNWSDERNIILRQGKDNAPPLDKSDPCHLIYEHSEQLFRAWHYMKVPRPSVRALSTGGAVFREALVKLHLECSELTNRKACRQSEPQIIPEAQSPVTVAETVSES
jgi:hypothetical protein